MELISKKIIKYTLWDRLMGGTQIRNTRRIENLNKKFSSRVLPLLVVLAVFLSLFSTASPSADAAARGTWAPNTAYAVSDTVTYSGTTYTCIQAHTSLVGWEPSNVPALWQSGGTGPQPTPTPQPTAPPTNGVIFYADINYGGNAVTLGVGNYTLSQLNASGLYCKFLLGWRRSQ